MKTEQTFGAYRYFVVQREQLSFFDMVKEKRAAAQSAFFTALERERKLAWRIADKRYLLVFEQKLSPDVVVCKFSMETHQTRYQESESGIESIDEPDYPYINAVFDQKRQIVLLEVKTTVFPSLSASRGRLSACLERSFAPYGFDVLFEGITDAEGFWDIVGESRGVCQLTLTLNAPNLFGGYNDTNEMLRDIAKTYNNTRATIRLENPKGKLTGISQENKALKDAMEYASGGGGEWKVTVLRRGAGQKTYRSEDNVRKVSVRRMERADGAGREDILQALDSVETILKQEGGRDEA